MAVTETKARHVAAGLLKRYADLSRRRGWTSQAAADRIGLSRARWFAIIKQEAPMVSLHVYLSLVEQLETK